MITKKKPGPKPKPANKKAQGRQYSYPARQLGFLDSIEEPSQFMQGLIDNSPEYQSYLKTVNARRAIKI